MYDLALMWFGVIGGFVLLVITVIQFFQKKSELQLIGRNTSNFDIGLLIIGIIASFFVVCIPYLQYRSTQQANIENDVRLKHIIGSESLPFLFIHAFQLNHKYIRIIITMHNYDEYPIRSFRFKIIDPYSEVDTIPKIGVVNNIYDLDQKQPFTHWTQPRDIPGNEDERLYTMHVRKSEGTFFINYEVEWLRGKYTNTVEVYINPITNKISYSDVRCIYNGLQIIKAPVVLNADTFKPRLLMDDR